MRESISAFDPPQQLVTQETADIAQVVTYSEAKGCQNAVLVYPLPLEEHIDEWPGEKRVRSLTLSLDGDLEKAGHISLNDLFFLPPD